MPHSAGHKADASPARLRVCSGKPERGTSPILRCKVHCAVESKVYQIMAALSSAMHDRRSGLWLVRPGSLGACETRVETERFWTFNASSLIYLPADYAE